MKQFTKLFREMCLNNVCKLKKKSAQNGIESSLIWSAEREFFF